MLKIKEFEWSNRDLNVYGDTQEEILVKNATIYNEIRYYDERTIYKDFGISEMQENFAEFADSWKKVFKALALDYKPLENYNMTENYNDYYIKDKNTVKHGGADTSTNYITSFDDSAFRNDTQTENNFADVITEYSNTQTDENNIASNEIHKTKNEKSGNLGVTTSQQMLQSEIDIRLKNYVKMFVKAFIDEIAFYI